MKCEGSLCMHACSQRKMKFKISNDDGDGGGDRPKIFVDRGKKDEEKMSKGK